MANCFQAADILLPDKHISLKKWACVACDQFSSQMEYWDRVRNFVGDAPSTYHMIFPEALLRQGQDRLDSIRRHMERYLDEGLFSQHRRSFIYLERTLENGTIRRGLVGQVDLEEYDFHPGCSARIRATEATVESRIPARMALLEGAPLEFPHTLLLCDDREDRIMAAAASVRGECLYDFDLMESGGHIRGFLISGLGVGVVNSAVTGYISAAEAELGDPMTFAVGDGNHSLAAAKACWEKLKPGLSREQQLWHPARYALVELENIQDPAIEFAPIHRLLRGREAAGFPSFLRRYAAPEGHAVRLLSREGGEETLYFSRRETPLVLERLQPLLDVFSAEHGCAMDYIHGEEALRQLTLEPDTLGILLPGIEKDGLFPGVLRNGVLPRKTFSMGSAREKRYYLEGKTRI